MEQWNHRPKRHRIYHHLKGIPTNNITEKEVVGTKPKPKNFGDHTETEIEL
jgi:hypothetical protein